MKLSSTGLDAVGVATIDMAIQQENQLALRRRWRFAQGMADVHPRQVDRYFPEQRDLLQLLVRLTEEEVERIARSTVPLFNVGPIVGLQDIAFSARLDELPPSGLERDNYDEVLSALSARMHALSREQCNAEALYNLTRLSSLQLSGFTTYQLRWLAQQPTAVLRPAVRTEFFQAAALRDTWDEWHVWAFGIVARNRDLVV